MHPGNIFKQLVESDKPLVLMGAINPYFALLAEHAGASCLYLSGGGVSAATLGLPDLGMTNLNDVAMEAQRILAVSKLPLIVDIDTGFGGVLSIQRTIQTLESIGVAGVHIEDQVMQKRCGHRPGKKIVSTEEMVSRIQSAVQARKNQSNGSFYIIARTDAYANEGLSGCIQRAKAYQEAGADALFPEAFPDPQEYHSLRTSISLPILANMTEFGKTPITSRDDLKKYGVDICLYPLSAFRSASKAAMRTYQCILEKGDQGDVLDDMETRKSLYHHLNYHAYEKAIDTVLEDSKK